MIRTESGITSPTQSPTARRRTTGSRRSADRRGQRTSAAASGISTCSLPSSPTCVGGTPRSLKSSSGSSGSGWTTAQTGIESTSPPLSSSARTLRTVRWSRTHGPACPYPTQTSRSSTSPRSTRSTELGAASSTTTTPIGSLSARSSIHGGSRSTSSQTS